MNRDPKKVHVRELFGISTRRNSPALLACSEFVNLKIEVTKETKLVFWR
jgi:hypothetical protein